MQDKVSHSGPICLHFPQLLSLTFAACSSVVRRRCSDSRHIMMPNKLLCYYYTMSQKMSLL